MGTRSFGRRALACAVLGACAASAQATRFDRGLVVDAREAVQLDPGDVVGTSAASAVALRVGARATVDADHVTIVNDGESTPNRRAYGVAVLDGGDISLIDSRVAARAPSGVGLHAQHGASIALERTDVTVASLGAGLTLDGTSRATLSDSAVRAPRDGYAIDTRVRGGGAATVAVASSSLSGRVVSGESGLRLHASDSRLVGDMARDAAGVLDVTLVRSHWQGAAQRLSSVRLERSDWVVEGNSRVDAIALRDASRVVFARRDNAFATLRARTWSGEGESTVLLHTRLDGGGPLRKQATDRLLVSGDASGRTVLHVENAGGAGASTAGRRAANGAADGISIVQVGGNAAPDTFVLAGDHVVVGPWRYELNGFAPDVSDPAQRLVDGEGGFWDFRLQSARVDERGLRAHPATRSVGRRARNALAPQVPAYLAMAHAVLGYAQTSADALERAAYDAPREPSLRVQAFGADVAYRSTLSFDDFGIAYRRRDRGLQFGGDAIAKRSGRAWLRVGAVVTLGTSHVVPKDVDGPASMRLDARGVALLAGVVTDGGWRASARYGMTHYRASVASPARGETLSRHRANGTLATLSAAYPWQPGTRLILEPRVGATWQRLRLNGAVDRDTIRIGATRAERLGGRVGARLSLPYRPEGRVLYTWTPFLETRYDAARDAGARATVGGERFPTGTAAGAWTAEAGARVELWSRTSAHVVVSRRLRTGRGGEEGLTAQAGVAITF